MSLALHTCAIPSVPAKLLATLGDRARVIVSGFDVSDRCFMADAEAGIAWCYRANMAGEFPVLEPDGQPAIVRMFGTVVIEHAAHTGKLALVDQAKDLLERRRAVGRKSYTDATDLSVEHAKDFGPEADEELADWFIYWLGYRHRHKLEVRKLHERVARLEEALRDCGNERAIRGGSPPEAA
jgi:hypothetical protein